MAHDYNIQANHLRIGTCSWKYDSWKSLLYDPDKRYRADDYLPDYARHFTTAEIDQWFWSLLSGSAKLLDPDMTIPTTSLEVNNGQSRNGSGNKIDH